MPRAHVTRHKTSQVTSYVMLTLVKKSLIPAWALYRHSDTLPRPHGDIYDRKKDHHDRVQNYNTCVTENTTTPIGSLNSIHLPPSFSFAHAFKMSQKPLQNLKKKKKNSSNKTQRGYFPGPSIPCKCTLPSPERLRLISVSSNAILTPRPRQPDA